MSELARAPCRKVVSRLRIERALPSRDLMHRSGVSGRPQGGRRLASSRGRWVETARTGARERQATSGGPPQLPPPFPSRPPSGSPSGPPPSPGLGQEPPHHSPSRPWTVPVPRPRPEPAEGRQQHAPPGELFLPCPRSLSRERASPKPGMGVCQGLWREEEVGRVGGEALQMAQLLAKESQ